MLLQGTTLSFVAKALHVAIPSNTQRRFDFDFEATDHIKTEMLQVVLDEGSKIAGKRIVELMVPASVNILAIKRADVYIAPNGSTRLLPNDILYVLAKDKQAVDLFGKALDVEV